MLSADLAERLRRLVATAVGQSVGGMQNILPHGAAARASAAAHEFFDLYDQRPVRDNQGGSGFNDSLWLFALARA